MTFGRPNKFEKFTPMQQRFIEAYIAEPNLTRAAAVAGYRHPKAQGHELINKPHVRAEIQRRQAARAERLEIDSDFVLQELKSLYDKFVQNVRPALNAKTGKALLDPDSGEPLFRFDGTAALKAMELIGKHIRVNAFQADVQVSLSETMADKIIAGRKRARIALRRDQMEDMPEPPALPKPRKPRTKKEL